MTVLEVVTFPPAEAYQTDPLAALKPFAAVLAKAGDIDSSRYVTLMVPCATCMAHLFEAVLLFTMACESKIRI